MWLDKVSRRRIYGWEIAGLTGRRATGKNWLWIYACRQSRGYIRNAIDACRLIEPRRFAVEIVEEREGESSQKYSGAAVPLSGILGPASRESATAPPLIRQNT